MKYNETIRDTDEKFLEYMSPELINYYLDEYVKEEYNDFNVFKSDVFSFGLVLIETATLFKAKTKSFQF